MIFTIGGGKIFSMKKIDRQRAAEYLNADKINTIALTGVLAANKDAEVYENQHGEGMMVVKGRQRYIYSPDKRFWDECFYTAPDDVCFACLHREIADYLKDNFGAFYDDYCHICAFLGDKPYVNPIIPDGYEVKNIDVKDLDYINDYYTYKGEGSRERLLEEITDRPSCALYRNGKIQAWNLIHADYSMGVMFVPPFNRGKGYAQIVGSGLLKKVIAAGRIPYVQIVSDNIPSLNLATQRLGFTKVFEACWVRKTPKE